jgi:hypothetical protein
MAVIDSFRAKQGILLKKSSRISGFHASSSLYSLSALLSSAASVSSTSELGELTILQKQKQVIEAIELFKIVREGADANFAHRITGDESWFLCQYESAGMFTRYRVDVIPKVWQVMSSRKTMVKIFFIGTRLMLLNHLPHGQKHNKDYFVDAVLGGISATRNHGQGQKVAKQVFIHMDNCKVHDAEQTSIKMQSMKMTRLPHPLYSPDFSSRGFWFFGRVKNSLRDEQFDDADALLEGLSNLFDQITAEELQSVFHAWIRRLTWSLASWGTPCQIVDSLKSWRRDQAGASLLSPSVSIGRGYKFFCSAGGSTMQ